MYTHARTHARTRARARARAYTQNDDYIIMPL